MLSNIQFYFNVIIERLKGCDFSRIKGKTIFAAISGSILWLVNGFIGLMGGVDVLIEVMIVFIIIDFITGIAVAFKDGELDSRICLCGGTTKIMKFFLVVVAFQMDRVTNGVTPLREIAIMFMIANEGISIIENLGALGIVSPAFLQKRFKQVRDRYNKGETHEERGKADE